MVGRGGAAGERWKGGMNYYERHIGDYLKDTAHLSLLEHGVYGRLLDVYYTREVAIPVDQVERLIGARAKDERAALAAVLDEFFTTADGMLTHSRCEREIERFKDKQAKAKRSAEARWSASKPQSEGNANASPDAMRTHSEGNALQTPDTRHQITEIPSEAKASAPAPPPPGPDPSPKDVVYALGLPMLLAAAVPEERGRSFLGLLLRCNAAEAVAEAVQRCAREGAIQPIAYLQGCLKTSKAKASAHSGFASKDYRDGVTEDGTIAI
jgi:uncharacterized protein YdaU (DUF1376 family)